MAAPAPGGEVPGRLFDEALLWALRGLQLRRRRARGASEGAHLGTRGGPGEDFFQHRAYVAGEDLRAVDFRASARSGHLLVKELHRPLRQPLILVVDSSASMQLFGKAGGALKVGAALGLLALRRGDPVSVIGLAPGSLRLAGRLLAPRHPLLALEQVFTRLEPLGQAELFTALLARWPVSLAGAHVVVISDLYGELEAARAAIARLAAGASAVTLVQVLAPEERDLPPSLAEVIDVESGARSQVGAETIARYRGRVDAWQAGLRGAVAGRGEWVELDAAQPVGLSLRAWLG